MPPHRAARRWRSIFGGLYEVSDDGIVRLGVDRRNCRRGHRMSLKTVRGYSLVFLSTPNKRGYYWVHRLVMEAFVGKIRKGYQVNHRNGIKADNRVENLEQVTGAENMRHAVENGLIPRGTETHNARLSDARVRQIRKEYSFRRVTLRHFAEKFGVGTSTIYHVLRGENWRHLR